MRRAIFLDRDGVLNRGEVRNGKLTPPPRPEAVELLPGVREGCAALRAAGFLLIVVTNQPEVARGSQQREVVEAINTVIRSRLPLDDVRVCYHDDNDHCLCRKPKPGLLLAAAKDWGIDFKHSFLVGDRWRDIEAGQNAGCRAVLVENGVLEERPCQPDARFASFNQAAEWILQNS